MESNDEVYDQAQDEPEGESFGDALRGFGDLASPGAYDHLYDKITKTAEHIGVIVRGEQDTLMEAELGHLFNVDDDGVVTTEPVDWDAARRHSVVGIAKNLAHMSPEQLFGFALTSMMMLIDLTDMTGDLIEDQVPAMLHGLDASLDEYVATMKRLIGSQGVNAAVRTLSDELGAPGSAAAGRSIATAAIFRLTGESLPEVPDEEES